MSTEEQEYVQRELEDTMQRLGYSDWSGKKRCKLTQMISEIALQFTKKNEDYYNDARQEKLKNLLIWCVSELLIMELDVKKIFKPTNNEYEAIKNMTDICFSLLDALFIFQSTIENWDDKECLEINKERMIKFYNKYSVNILWSRR